MSYYDQETRYDRGRDAGYRQRDYAYDRDNRREARDCEADDLAAQSRIRVFGGGMGRVGGRQRQRGGACCGSGEEERGEMRVRERGTRVSVRGEEGGGEGGKRAVRETECGEGQGAGGGEIRRVGGEEGGAGEEQSGGKQGRAGAEEKKRLRGESTEQTETGRRQQLVVRMSSDREHEKEQRNTVDIVNLGLVHKSVTKKKMIKEIRKRQKGLQIIT